MRCPSCGADHPLLDPIFRRPDPIVALSPEARRGRVRESDDLCSFSSGVVERAFVRCVLPVRLYETSGDTVQWGVWAEVGRAAFRRILERWSDPAQAGERPMDARLANRVPDLDDTLDLPLTLRLIGPKTRPEVAFTAAAQHPFALECREGVTLHRAHEWLGMMTRRPVRQVPRTFACAHVFADLRPILRVEREGGGDWRFLCGSDAHEEHHLIGRSFLRSRDPTLRHVTELREGEGTERKGVGSPWVARPTTPSTSGPDPGAKMGPPGDER